MSGGMDIDWDYRDKLLNKARAKFPNWSKEQLIEHSEVIYNKIQLLESQEKEIAENRRKLEMEQEELLFLLKDNKFL